MPLVQRLLVYLDWSIFDGLSKGRFSDLREKLIIARDEEIIHIPYSEWHLHEATNVASEIANRDGLIDRNLSTIRNYTNMVYLWEADNPMGWIIGRGSIESTFDIITSQKLLAFSAKYLEPMLLAITKVRNTLIPYGLEPVILNNYDADQAVEKINAILLKPENIEKYRQYAPNGITFEELIRLSISLMPDTGEVAKVSGIYFMVDQLGYYSERSVEKRVMSLWRDSLHVAWASRSEIFVSNDRDQRMKAQLTYRALGISTLVLDPEQASTVISGLIRDGDHIKEEYEKFRSH